MSETAAWKFATTSALAWEDMLASCRRAQKTIDLEQYIFGTGEGITRTFTDLLREKAKAGVRVRLLLDAVGSFSFYESAHCLELRSGGIDIAFHRATFLPNLKRFLPLILRDHRKLLIVDGQEAHIGGVIIDECARHWRDTSVRLMGQIVADCERAFALAWEKAQRMQPMGRVLTTIGGKQRFFLAGNSYHLRDKDLYRAIIRQITMAKKSIAITTPYFSLTHDLKRALYYAAERGVSIRLLLPTRSDNLLADCLSRLYYRRLLRHRIQLFHYTDSFLHAKSIVVDTNWASIGSCNFDWLSFRLNYELNVVSDHRDFVDELQAQFDRDIDRSEPVTAAPPYLHWLLSRWGLSVKKV